MEATATNRILLCACASADADELSALLTDAGCAVSRQPPEACASDRLPAADLVVLDAPAGTPWLMSCRRLCARSPGGHMPLLVILGESSPTARSACLEAGADAYLLRPFAPRELIAQVRALSDAVCLQRRLADKTAELRLAQERLQQAYRQMSQDLEATRRVQRSLQPRCLPQVGQVRLAAHYRPCGRVGGDCHGAVLLDGDHIGLYVADAMGHGVTAGLLTLFLRQALQPSDDNGSPHRILPPDEVLDRVNRALLELALPDVPFLSMVYAVLNCTDGTCRFARAGHPLPLHLPREGPIEEWHAAGNLLGVFPTGYSTQTRRLGSGDKLLIVTDGLAPQPVSHDNLLACAGAHRHLPAQEFVDRLAHELLAQSTADEDVTLLGLELAGPRSSGGNSG
jgi:serine phosphatase RsbU (regulator of sigma subunit)